MRRSFSPVFWSAIYFALLAWSYVTIVSPAHREFGYPYHPAASGVLVMGLALTMAVSASLPVRISRPSSLAVWALFLTVGVPSLAVTAYSFQGGTGDVLRLQLLVGAAFVILTFTTRYHLRCLAAPRISRARFVTLLLVISGVSYAVLLLRFGFHFRFVDPSSPYTTRFAYLAQSGSRRAVGGGRGTALSYFVTWQSLVINPALFMYGVTQRRRIFVLGSLIGQCLIYSFTGERAVLLSLAVLFAIWAAYVRDGSRTDRPGSQLSRLLVLLTVGAVMLDRLLHFKLASDLIITRIGGNNGVTTGVFVSFFAHHPTIRLSDGLLQFYTHYPYSVPYTEILGSNFSHITGASWNGNFIADAYANFGVPGVLMGALAVGAVLNLYDCATGACDFSWAVALIALPVVVGLANTGLQTTLLSGGMALSFIVGSTCPFKQGRFTGHPQSPHGAPTAGRHQF